MEKFITAPGNYNLEVLQILVLKEKKIKMIALLYCLVLGNRVYKFGLKRDFYINRVTILLIEYGQQTSFAQKDNFIFIFSLHTILLRKKKHTLFEYDQPTNLAQREFLCSKEILF